MKKLILWVIAVSLSGIMAFTSPAADWRQEEGPGAYLKGEGSGALSLVTSVPNTRYSPGVYAVGTDIPAGEYVLLALPQGKYPSYEIRSSNDFSTKDSMIEYCNFMYNVIVTLEPGQFVKLEDCTASPMNEVPNIDCRKGQGYKVGVQIPAGTYRLQSETGSYDIFYILSRPTTRRDQVADYSFLRGDSYLTVSEGQYLLLVGCLLDEYLGSEACPQSDVAYPAGVDVQGAYKPGLYLAGADIPAGNYRLYVSPDCVRGRYADYEIRSQAVYTDPYQMPLAHDVFDTWRDISLESGTYLKLNNCIAVPLG